MDTRANDARWRIRCTAALVLTGVVAAGGCTNDREHDASPPTSTAPAPSAVVPTTAPSSEVARHLREDGALYLEFRRLSAGLLALDEVADADARRARCVEVARALDASVDPIALYDAAVSIPDPVLAELAVNDRTARSNALVACNDGDVPATDAAIASVREINKLVVAHPDVP